MPSTTARKPVVVRGGGALDGAHGGHVVGLQDAARGVLQQVLRELLGEERRASKQRVAKARRPVHRGASTSVPDASMGTPLSFARHNPTTSKFSSE